MKKAISMLLALMMTASLAACGGDSEAATENTQQSVQSTEALQTETTVPVGFEEIVLVDNVDCAFTISGIDEDNLWGYTLKAYLHNKTDKELLFTFEDVSVNGFMCDPLWAATIAAGKKSNEEISFLSASLEENGITTVTDITFTLRIYDGEDYMADPVFLDSFTIYPLGEDAVTAYERVPAEDEIVLFDNEQCTMIVTGMDTDNIWGYGLNIYLENKTGSALMFSAEDVSVNGFMCDPFWSFEVAPGKRANTTISWFEEDFISNGIETVEEIEMTATVQNAEDWFSDPIAEETFTITP